MLADKNPAPKIDAICNFFADSRGWYQVASSVKSESSKIFNNNFVIHLIAIDVVIKAITIAISPITTIRNPRISKDSDWALDAT
jgi:hypothetical protein